jgi:hypothetical protein
MEMMRTIFFGRNDETFPMTWTIFFGCNDEDFPMPDRIAIRRTEIGNQIGN